ncbi:MFS transporter [Brevibacterium sandarakinum]|uniref:MFS transporter n=1 Tax=Brevibacterium sandarakinum TaxID=629680 RepID=UPI000B8A42E9|nr:MFS transporter [Brevibacterium sandarakinum]
MRRSESSKDHHGEDTGGRRRLPPSPPVGSRGRIDVCRDEHRVHADLVVPIQNHLPELLDAPRSATAWVLTIALLVAAVTTPISGRLGDILGMRRVMIALLAMMTLGSLIAALSGELTWLLVGRALQGVSMGATAVGISMMSLVDNRKIRIAGISIISSSMGFGGAIGLPLAAWIAEIGDWKLLFWRRLSLEPSIWLFVIESVDR